MFTECPQCHTLFRVGAAQLHAAGGKVRCGQCQTVFNALKALSETVPTTAPVRTHEATQHRAADPAPAVAESTPAATPSRSARTEQNENGERPLPFDVPEDLPEIVPIVSTPTRERAAAPTSSSRRLARVAGAIGALLLTLLLAAQVAWLERDRMVRTPWGHKFISALCEPLGCTAPLPRAPDKIRVVAREIRSKAATAALAFRIRFVNQARFAQAYPDLELALFDGNSGLIGRRRFKPAEYLATDAHERRLMAPGAVAEVRLDLRDPGSHTDQFRIEFL